MPRISLLSLSICLRLPGLHAPPHPSLSSIPHLHDDLLIVNRRMQTQRNFPCSDIISLYDIRHISLERPQQLVLALLHMYYNNNKCGVKRGI